MGFLYCGRSPGHQCQQRQWRFRQRQQPWQPHRHWAHTRPIRCARVASRQRRKTKVSRIESSIFSCKVNIKFEYFRPWDVEAADQRLHHPLSYRQPPCDNKGWRMIMYPPAGLAEHTQDNKISIIHFPLMRCGCYAPVTPYFSTQRKGTGWDWEWKLSANFKSKLMTPFG